MSNCLSSRFTISDHMHIDAGHTHADGGHTHGYKDRYPDTSEAGSQQRCSEQSGHWGPNGADKSSDRFDCSSNHITSASTANDLNLHSSKSGIGPVDSDSR